MIQRVLIFLLLLLLAVPAFAGDDFHRWIKQEQAISHSKMFLNISPPGTPSGFVIASPSRVDPDYFFHWVRDAALTMEVVVREYEKSATSFARLERDPLHTLVLNYVHFSRSNQLSPALSGLGEPKFNSDGTPYSGPWGRPQNDSPALRALTLTHLAQIWLRVGRRDLVSGLLYDSNFPTRSVVKADLEYVSLHWGELSFDLWEEVLGQHFYTLMVQHKALIEGAKLADLLGDLKAANWYRDQAAGIESLIHQHWDEKFQFIRATLRSPKGGLKIFELANKWTGLDSAVILAVLHTDLPWAPSNFYPPTDEKVIATADRLQRSFSEIYGINLQGIEGTAIGRYPEDVYYGGNPWFLTTNAFAELNIKMAQLFRRNHTIRITSANRSFFEDLLGKVLFLDGKQLVLSSMDPAFQRMIVLLEQRGESFLKRVRYHLPADGSMAEQFDRNTGFMKSARDLTWSYASFLTAAENLSP